MRLLCIFILSLLFFTDMIFAATLLEKAKLNYNKFRNCIHTSSQKNIVVNDNKSNTNITNASSNNKNKCTISDIEDIFNNAIFNNTNKNPLQDNSTSDIENNNSDDTGKLKV